MTRKGKKNISYTQRLQLEALLKAGLNKKQIAAQLGICLATVMVCFFESTLSKNVDSRCKTAFCRAKKNNNTLYG